MVWLVGTSCKDFSRNHTQTQVGGLWVVLVCHPFPLYPSGFTQQVTHLLRADFTFIPLREQNDLVGVLCLLSLSFQLSITDMRFVTHVDRATRQR